MRFMLVDSYRTDLVGKTRRRVGGVLTRLNSNLRAKPGDPKTPVSLPDECLSAPAEKTEETKAGLYDLLSKGAKIVLNVLTGMTVASLLYFYYYEQGPMFWMAGWIADSDGQFYPELAFLFSFLPICMAAWLTVYLIDRGVVRVKRFLKPVVVNGGSSSDRIADRGCLPG